MKPRFAHHLKSLIAAIACLAAVPGAAGQMTARSALDTAPDLLLPTLPREVRLDMVDYFAGGSDRPSASTLGAKWRITEMDDDRLVLKADSVATVEIAIVGPTILFIETLDLPEPDSTVRAFDSKWNELDTSKFLPSPTLADWAGKISAADMEWLRQNLPFLTASATFDHSTMSLIYIPTPGSYLDINSKERVVSLIRPSLTYTLSGNSFKLKKK